MLFPPMNDRGVLLLMVLLVWVVCASYWYVCGIKGFCTAASVFGVDIEAESRFIEQMNQRPEPSLPPAVETITLSDPEQPKNVAVQEIVVTCDEYITESLRISKLNTPSEVRKLKQFLNTYEDASLFVNGTFDPDTLEAVKSFQLKYRSQILDPWNETEPTGYVYKTTKAKINQLYCDHTEN